LEAIQRYAALFCIFRAWFSVVARTLVTKFYLFKFMGKFIKPGVETGKIGIDGSPERQDSAGCHQVVGAVREPPVWSLDILLIMR
jgi:hypothetical protein